VFNEPRLLSDPASMRPGENATTDTPPAKKAGGKKQRQ
jgi:hypothetical protein